MKSQAILLQSPRGPGRSAVLPLAAMALSAAIVVIAPLQSHAHEFHPDGHAAALSHRAYGHAGAARSLRTDWHGGGGVGFHAAGPGVHAAAPGYHGGYGGGWHGDGRWNHGWHGGYYGWWFVDAGIWTAYPYYPGYYPYGYYPSYAYPAPYAYVPPEAPAGYNLPAPQQTWYFCDAARAYYPAVQSCPAGWRPVTAQQAAPPAAAAPR